MHDPLVVAFEIRRPWPSRSKMHDAKPGGPRWKWRHRHVHRPDTDPDPCSAHGCDTTRDPFPWWKPSSYSAFMTVAGRGFYWPAIITVWHREPGGADSGEVCRHYDRATRKILTGWRWHVWHWRIQVSPLQQLHRRVFGRCGWCGGRSTKRRPVNVSHQWDAPRRPPFRIDRSAFHMDCSSVEHAHRCCTCEDPMPGRPGVPGESTFRCVMCGGHHDERRVGPRLTATRLLKTIPRGEFHPGTYHAAEMWWAAAREDEHEAEKAGG